MPCWVASDEHMTCRVVVQAETTIPAWSEKIMRINIQNAGFLADTGFLQPSPDVIRSKEILMIAGVVPTRSNQVQVRVVNFSDAEVTLHPKQNLGTCESYYEQDNHVGQEAAEVRTLSPVSNEIPEHICELFNDSSSELTQEERSK